MKSNCIIDHALQPTVNCITEFMAFETEIWKGLIDSGTIKTIYCSKKCSAFDRTEVREQLFGDTSIWGGISDADIVEVFNNTAV